MTNKIKVSKLISDDSIAALRKDGMLDTVVGRKTGATTARAFSALSQAMIQPGKVIVIGSKENKEIVEVVRKINDLCRTLDLAHLKTELGEGGKNYVITYDIYREI